MAVTKKLHKLEDVLDIVDQLLADGKIEEANATIDDIMDALGDNGIDLIKKAKALDAEKDKTKKAKLARELNIEMTKAIVEKLGLDKCSCTSETIFTKGCICGGK